MENPISTDKRKRVRDESNSSDSPDSSSSPQLPTLPESKIRRVDSDSVDDSSESQLTRVDSSESQLTRVDSSESGHDSVFDSDVQIQDDIFNMLDDADNVPERDSVLGLDSVIKSFEEEILAPGFESGQVDPAVGPDSGELQTNLGYLFEASDDELGLPPTGGSVEEPGRVAPEGLDMIRFPEFDDDFNGYDGFGFGTGLLSEGDVSGAGDFSGDGLFDYAEPAVGGLWRSESLQAM